MQMLLGLKRPMILQSPFLILLAISSAPISLPLLSLLSFPYVILHRTENLNISPCSFLPGLFVLPLPVARQLCT